MQLVVDQHQHQQRQQRGGAAQTELAPECVQPAGEPDRGHPQQRAHRRQRRRADQVAHAGLVAVQDHLADRRRIGLAPLQRLMRHAAGVGDLEPVRPVAPGPEHAEVEQRREPQPHQRKQHDRGQPGPLQQRLCGDLVAQRPRVLGQAVAAHGNRPKRGCDSPQQHHEAGQAEHVQDLQHDRRQRRRRIAEPEDGRQPGGDAGLSGPVQREARARAGDHHHEQSDKDGAGVQTGAV